MSLTAVYVSLIGLIGLMILAAFQNRRSGWKKPQTGLGNLQHIDAIWRSLHVGKTEPETRIPATGTLAASGCAAFSAQLANLQRSLHREGRVAPQTGPALEHAELKR